MKNIWLFLSAITVLMFAVLGMMLLSGTGRHGMYMYRRYDRASYDSMGESIYYAAIGTDGRDIPYADGPHWMRTIMEKGCVSCHGIDGRGGFPLMMTSAIAPDVTHDALISEEHYHGGEREVHEGRYTDEAIKQAITQGIDPSGRHFSRIMPRWKMTEEELAALLTYLKEL